MFSLTLVSLVIDLWVVIGWQDYCMAASWSDFLIPYITKCSHFVCSFCLTFWPSRTTSPSGGSTKPWWDSPCVQVSQLTIGQAHFESHDCHMTYVLQSFGGASVSS